MGVKAFSGEFADSLAGQLNVSSVYKQAAKGWRWTVGLVIEAEPDRGVPEALGIYLDLNDGEARSVSMVPVAQAQACDFVVSAPYTQWKRVMKEELGP
ncbi:MAG TPA: hypothetical protein VG015_03585, partial [Candidatus Dormibacteraeota bacterium]|nr:hypothetical protein [Candidatus Dormibacteraeota bacterium]